MKVTVGRVVHFYDDMHFPTPLAALVTSVENEVLSVVSLAYFAPYGAAYSAQNVSYSETPKRGHWSWPLRASQ